MAFGEQRGNHWLLIPAIRFTLIIAAHYDILPGLFGSRERILGFGFALSVVGIVCAGLFGHIVWLVPIALLLVSPLMILFWMQEKYTVWRRKYRAGDGGHGIVQAFEADESSAAPKSSVDREFES